jgi:hypothetical protein
VNANEEEGRRLLTPLPFRERSPICCIRVLMRYWSDLLRDLRLSKVSQAKLYLRLIPLM